eukprot:Gb_32912 [translate_table: standard]
MHSTQNDAIHPLHEVQASGALPLNM